MAFTPAPASSSLARLAAPVLHSAPGAYVAQRVKEAASSAWETLKHGVNNAGQPQAGAARAGGARVQGIRQGCVFW